MSCFNGAWVLLEEHSLGIAAVCPRNSVAHDVPTFTFHNNRPHNAHTSLVIGSLVICWQEGGEEVFGIWDLR